MRSRSRDWRLWSDMRKVVRDKIIDDVMETYVDWRQACVDAESAYGRWSIARSTDPARAFAAYTAAAIDEELAAMDYAAVLQRAARLFGRDRRRRSRSAPRHGAARRPSRGPRRRGPVPRASRRRTGATRGPGAIRSAGAGRSRDRPGS
jgi:hypothetical protein